MSDFSHVKPRDKKIRAASFNTMLDAARHFQTLQKRLAGNASGVLESASGAIVLVANDTDDHISRFRSLVLREPLIDPSDNEEGFQNQLVMKADYPDDAEADFGKFCVLLDSLPARQTDSGDHTYSIGRAIVSGLTQAKINVVDEAHEWADIGTDELLDTLEEAGGARIIWKQTGTGEKWAVLLLDSFNGISTDPDCPADES